jgi:hypothetical protein
VRRKKEKMKQKTKDRLVGIGILIVGVSSALTGHSIIAYSAGIATGCYMAGWAVKTLGFYTLLPGQLEAVREEAFELGREEKESE